MKHKHYDMIVATAANTELAVFSRNKCSNGDYWIQDDAHSLILHPDIEHFLCLSKHANTVEHILNGGNGEVNYGEFWQDCNVGQPVKWSRKWWCMNDNCESRIKPKKEKRWIAVKGNAVSGIYKTKRELELMYATTSGVQFIEIEVEI